MDWIAITGLCLIGIGTVWIIGALIVIGVIECLEKISCRLHISRCPSAQSSSWPESSCSSLVRNAAMRRI